jgi:hypothetical protein
MSESNVEKLAGTVNFILSLPILAVAVVIITCVVRGAWDWLVR